MQIMTQRLYDFLEDVKANITHTETIAALRAIALDALLLAQELENAQTRSDSDEGLVLSLWRF